jgi:hypothetical protein
MTAAPGHKLTQRLIEQEAYRRIMTGRAPETLSELAQEILDWFRETYPGTAALTLHEVEDHVRATWRRRHKLIGDEL